MRICPKRILLAIALVGSALLLPAAAQGPPPGRPGGFGPPFYEFLDLTAAQKEQITALREQERTASEPYRIQLREISESLRAAIQAATFDEAAVRELAAAEAQVNVELRVIGARTEAAIYRLLTADQQAKLTELRQTRPRQPGR